MGSLPTDEAIAAIKTAIKKTYGKRGEAVVRQNYAAVDSTLAHLHQVDVPDTASSDFERPPIVPEFAPEFIKSVTARMIEGVGDSLPVSALPVDGTYPNRYNPMGKAERRYGSSRLGRGNLYPMW